MHCFVDDSGTVYPIDLKGRQNVPEYSLNLSERSIYASKTKKKIDENDSNFENVSKFFFQIAGTSEKLMQYVTGLFSITQIPLISLLTKEALHLFHRESARFVSWRDSEKTRLRDLYIPRFDSVWRECKETVDRLIPQIFIQNSEKNKKQDPVLSSTLSTLQEEYCLAWSKFDMTNRDIQNELQKRLDAVDREYKKRQILLWIEIFRDPQNRIEVWRD